MAIDYISANILQSHYRVNGTKMPKLTLLYSFFSEISKLRITIHTAAYDNGRFHPTPHPPSTALAGFSDDIAEEEKCFTRNNQNIDRSRTTGKVTVGKRGHLMSAEKASIHRVQWYLPSVLHRNARETYSKTRNKRFGRVAQNEKFDKRTKRIKRLYNICDAYCAFVE